jgi:hypothetical protein
MRLTVPAGVDHDIWEDGINANRIVQPLAAGDFEAEVKFASEMDSLYQTRGIIVESSVAGDALRFEILHDGMTYYLFGASIVGGVGTYNTYLDIGVNNPTYMRVKRTGNTWTHSYSFDGTNWEGDTFTLAFAGNRIGPYAGNSADTAGSEPEHTVIFDYFYNTAARGPGDSGANAYALTATTVGSGAVTKDPLQTTYGCSQVVTLTAVPGSGYQFSAWGGDLTGTTNPATITMDAAKTVTATFTTVPEGTYTLLVNTVGGGSVTKAPDQWPYNAGTVVTLTPVPDPGWKFSGWSGDLTGNANPATITMEGAHKIVTATFVPTTFTLTINAAGGGSVTKDPDQATYITGTFVLLTAVPAAGRQFGGWSGDLTGSDNPALIIMDGNKTVTATFVVPEKNEVFLPMLIRP